MRTQRFSSAKAVPVFLMYLIAGLSISYSQTATVSDSTINKYSIGISASHFAYDAGIGLELTTAAIWNQKLCLRIRGNYVWSEAYKAMTNEWSGYKSFAAAMVYNSRFHDRFRVFAEVGFFNVIPDVKLSDKKNIQGLYELTGLELYIVHKEQYHIAYYFGAGFNYTGAHAEKIESNPQLASGLNFTTGLRYYF